MIPALLHCKRLVSFRIETSVVLAVIIVLLILPGAAVAALTNLGELLENDITAGNSGDGVLYTGLSPAENTYEWGNCTFWVFIQRQKADQPIPNTWGNAATWAKYAGLQGYKVDQTPSVGAIMQTANSAQGLGHVAYVTEVNPNTGEWKISEMNVKGLNVISERTFSAANALDYNFIHGKQP